MSVGNIAQGGGDPRLSITGDEKVATVGDEVVTAPARPHTLAIRDPNVKFEEYLFYANQTRAEQDAEAATEAKVGWLSILWPSKKMQHVDGPAPRRLSSIARSGKETGESPSPTRAAVNEEEWINAQRALRQASGAACFYLITTDILGPFGLAYSFATVGWAPGVVLFTLFAVLAGYSGYLEWKMFMWTDSFRYPTLTYGDLAYRIYGQAARIPINILQSIQLILTVSLITISNGQALSIMAKFKLCYIVCVIILVIAGMLLGQIRTLQKFGWLANVAVFMNVFIMILTMAVVAHTEPNFTAAGVLSAGASLMDGSIDKLPNGKYPPVQHYTNIPNTGSFVAALNGIMNTVFAYGGANIFTNFMAEMKRPKDFLKAMWISQFFIWFVYMFYGLFLYGYQGQYSINPSPQTISPYWALVIANLFYILSATIAAVLYGNIGLKVIYNNIGVEILHLPPLTAKSGKIIWVVLIPIYWALAFVIGAVIPNFAALVGVVGAICIVQFTYSLPPFLFMGAKTMVNAMQPGEGFDPVTKKIVRHDTGLKRWIRGFTSGSLIEKAIMFWNLIYFLGALSLGGLGAYASITLIIDTFKSGDPGLTTFSCTSPLDGVYF